MIQNDKTLFHVAALLYSYKSTNFKTENILKKIIESMLVINRNQAHTCIELSVTIEKRMNMAISPREIEMIVCNSQNKGFAVDYSNGDIKFCLNQGRYDYIMNMNTRNMDTYIQEFIQLNNYSETEKQIIEKYLYVFYRKNFNDIQNALGEQKESYLPVDSEQFSDEEFEIIRKFNDWDDEGKNEQMLALASYAMEYTLIAGEAGIKNSTHIDNVFRGKNIYIDTNILFYCLGVNGETYEESNKMFLKRCKDCNENIVISYYTDAELRSTLAHFEDEINRLNNPLIHNVKMQSYFLNNDVYHYYIKWSRGRRQLNEGKYFIRFLYDKYEKLIEEFDISIEKAIPFSEEKLATDEKLREYESEIVRSSLINYDARNIYYIEKKRKSDETNFQMAKDIFISADRNLQYWDMYREKSAPVVISPSTWLLLISRLIGRDEDDYKCFLNYINQANREQVINNKEFFEVLKTICDIVEDVKQQESVVEVMVEEEFAFLQNNGEKRTTDFIYEKTKEKTYKILEKKIDDLSNKLERVEKQMNDEKKMFEEKEREGDLAYHSLENEIAKQEMNYKTETDKLMSESAEKDKLIETLNNKLNIYPKIVFLLILLCVITVPIVLEFISIFVVKNPNPISYQICSFFYDKSIFDDGNKIDTYGKFLAAIAGFIMVTVDWWIIKKVIGFIKKVKND